MLVEKGNQLDVGEGAEEKDLFEAAVPYKGIRAVVV